MTSHDSINVLLLVANEHMIIEPVFSEWGDGESIGYRVVSKVTGAVLGFGETRSEALAKAHSKMFAIAE